MKTNSLKRAHTDSVEARQEHSLNLNQTHFEYRDHCKIFIRFVCEYWMDIFASGVRRYVSEIRSLQRLIYAGMKVARYEF